MQSGSVQACVLGQIFDYLYILSTVEQHEFAIFACFLSPLSIFGLIQERLWFISGDNGDVRWNVFISQRHKLDTLSKFTISHFTFHIESRQKSRAPNATNRKTFG